MYTTEELENYLSITQGALENLQDVLNMDILENADTISTLSQAMSKLKALRDEFEQDIEEEASWADQEARSEHQELCSTYRWQQGF